MSSLALRVGLTSMDSGDTDTLEKMQRRVEHDLYYIDNWSFLFDLRIVLLTAFFREVYVKRLLRI
jgi:lipopolysaccharide/colanic/teichoic acid biosynthesis glycosyltransferase